MKTTRSTPAPGSTWLAPVAEEQLPPSSWRKHQARRELLGELGLGRYELVLLEPNAAELDDASPWGKP